MSPVSRYATQAGKAYEGELMKYLRDSGFDVERLRLSGAEDEGDLLLRNENRRFVIEAKRRKEMDLSGWVKEAQLEAKNYSLHRGIVRPYFVVVHKARGKSLGESYLTTTLNEFVAMLEEGVR